MAALAATEWLHGTEPVWAWLAAAAGALALGIVVAKTARSRRRPARPPLAAGLTALAAASIGAVLVSGVMRIRSIECCWERRREVLLTNASEALEATLSQAAAEARRLADRAAAAAALPERDAFRHLERALASGTTALERGALITGANGEPWAWAGRHRFVPERDSSELAAAITPFYVALEARRQTLQGRIAVGHVLLDAADEVPDRERALAVAFAREHGVVLRFFAPESGPASSDEDVLDFCSTACDSSGPVDTLFSVVPEPASQGEAKITTVRATARLALAVLGALLVLLLVAAPPGASRWAVLGLCGWTLARAAQGVALEPSQFLSSTTFFRPALGMFSASAGSLAALGALLVMGAVALHRRARWSRRWWHVLPAALLVAAAPYMLRYFARGITPPAAGTSIVLWLSWQLALAATSMGLVLLAAALIRDPKDPPLGVPWTVAAACVWAVLAAAGGLWLWSPSGAWPEWYQFVWIPALVGVLAAAPTRWVLFGTATVAGTAAALLTWGASLEGRLSLAQRDAQRLGREGDAVALAFLERMGVQIAQGPAPRGPSELYALWLHSPLAAEAYPTVLALWGERGELLAELRLAALDLPRPLLAALVRTAEPPAPDRVIRLERIPGVHYVLVAPLPDGDVLTVGVGPRTRLVPPDRIARFLRGDAPREPPYAISLSLPTEPGGAATPILSWARNGWTARGEQRVAMIDGLRHVHARVQLGDPWALLARGTLVVALDLALLVVLWLLSRFTAEGWLPRLPPVLALLRTSYRARLAAALVGFVVLPVLLFALWSFARLADEARRAGDLLIRQTLKDAEATAGALTFARAPDGDAGAVTDLGLRLDAELWLYSDGVLAASSAPVLAELGLVERLMEPDVYRFLLEDEIELLADATTAGRPVRVGYRVVYLGPLGRRAVLAAPQLLDDERVRREQEDLALALLLGTLAGLVAAVVLAGLAARALARPVADLRDAAAAVGRGAPPDLPRAALQEFQSVFTAFERMAADVEEGREALEAARRRTARVLANVATGVVALDRDLTVTIANPRAQELLGARLEPGQSIGEAVGGLWAPVWSAVSDYLRESPRTSGAGDIDEREFEIDGRQIRVQIAPLGAGGCVVALDDATALTRAARILAWGEMARQVAHEIKNPLTPIRLGVQHLQRIRAAPNFDATLEETAGRILAEIDRLDDIARAFARFGTPGGGPETGAAMGAGGGAGAGAEPTPLEAVDAFRTASEVVQLYAIGQGADGQQSPVAGPRFEVAGEPGAPVLARQTEVKEVLINLLENARQAEARRVVVRVGDGGRRLTVADDGRGIPADLLPRVFEPTFSTTSSGAGLGLPIARRLVESWGGTITIESRMGQGTSVIITLEPVPAMGDSAAP